MNMKGCKTSMPQREDGDSNNRVDMAVSLLNY